MRRAPELRQKRFPEESHVIATGMNNLGTMYINMGKYAEGEALCTRALAIRKKAFGTRHPEYRATARNLAALYRLTEREGKAAEFEKLAASAGDAKG